MKKTRTLGVIIAALGVLLILTPWVIFPVCGVGRYAPPEGTIAGHHACHGTLKAETVIGAATIAVALLPIMWPSRKTLLAASSVTGIAAVLVILFPTTITGLCMMKTMPCQKGTLPALVAVAVMMVMAAGAGVYVFVKEKN